MEKQIIRIWWIWIVLFLIVCGGSVKAEPAARMVLVLDASGSMWGQIEGKAKIQIAKEVMGELVAAVPGEFYTGLMVYGHRRKGDCQDIEMMIPVGQHDATAMKAKIEAISPKGKTPLSESVRQAAEALRFTEEQATVVLVSDGLETCDIDPCALAAELAMSGVDFTVHVIGFDIGKEDQGRLSCLAEKTGGLFLPADNAGSLRDALFQTLKEVQAPPPPVVDDPGTAQLTGPASVPAGSTVTVQWDGPDSRNDYVGIAEKETKTLQVREYAYTKLGNPSVFPAPGKVGDYDVVYVHGQSGKVIGRADITVTPVEATVNAPVAVDVAVTFDVQWQGPDYEGDYITISREDQPPSSYIIYAYTSEGSPLKLRAPSEPGAYEVRYIMGKGSVLLAKTVLEIRGVGATIEAPAVADVGTQFEVSWTGPGNEPDYVAIASPDQEPGEYQHYTYTSTGSPLKLQAPSKPGNYEVRYILGSGNKLLAKSPIAIKAVSAAVQVPEEVDAAAVFEVSWQGPGNDNDYISIAAPDQQPGEYQYYTYTGTHSPLQLQAPADPGSYEVRYILGLGNELLVKVPITIKAVSATVQAPEEVAAAAVFEVSWQGPGNDNDYISIAAPDQQPGEYQYYTYTGTHSPLQLQAPADPGSYEVRYILGLGNQLLAKVPITIKAVSATVQGPEEVDAAAVFEVSWQGPGNDKDYISIASPDQQPGVYHFYTYTRTGSPLQLQAPADPGSYEVRYILGQENKMLANMPITISPVNATITVPAAVAVDSSIEITWEGPGYKPDYICIAKPGDPPGKYLGYTYVKTGNPLKLKAPKDPGGYEVRYILGLGNRLLDKKAITVE